MMTDIHSRNKQLLAPVRAALYDYDERVLDQRLRDAFAPDCAIHLAFPFEDLDGPDALLDRAYRPLAAAMPDLERRDYIVIAGEAKGANWIGCAGTYMGTLVRPWLEIPPTGHAVAMRFHEFFRVEENRVVEMQALWDIPQVMRQAWAWPLAPSLGVEWLVPGPATQDGLVPPPRDGAQSAASAQLVHKMLTSLGRSSEGVEAMELERYWHPKMNWYGPAAIGSTRRIEGFRRHHQIPFLHAMPNRRGDPDGGFLFGDGDYVGFTAWPGMAATLSGDGWLGIAPSNREITLRSLDFWRCENGLIRENWVLVDLLDVYSQLGVDVFARMQELVQRD